MEVVVAEKLEIAHLFIINSLIAEKSNLVPEVWFLTEPRPIDPW